VHAGALPVRAEHGSLAAADRAATGRRSAQSAESAIGLSLPHALSVRDRAVRRGGAAASRNHVAPSGRLSSLLITPFTLTGRTPMTEPTISDAHREPEERGRRDFLKASLLGGAAAVTASAVTTPAAQAQPGMVPGTRNHYYVPANDKTV